MSELSLSATRQTVMALMASGSTARAAAAAAGVHRNTIANWLCSSDFRQALARARYETAVHFREQAESIALDAYVFIRALIADPQAPAAIRLKAALAMIDRAAAPLPEPPAEIPEIVHNIAQSEPAAAPVRESPTEIPEIVHKIAQSAPPLQSLRSATPPRK